MTAETKAPGQGPRPPKAVTHESVLAHLEEQLPGHLYKAMKAETDLKAARLALPSRYHQLFDDTVKALEKLDKAHAEIEHEHDQAESNAQSEAESEKAQADAEAAKAEAAKQAEAEVQASADAQTAREAKAEEYAGAGAKGRTAMKKDAEKVRSKA